MSLVRPLLLLVLLLTGLRCAEAAPAVDPHVAELTARLERMEAAASASSAIDTGDNVWVLLGAMLVLFMTIPGLSLFYGGLARRQHVLGTMMHSLAITAVITVLWSVVGFSLAFGDGNAWIGNAHQYLMLRDVVWSPGGIPGPNAAYAGTIPFGTFFLFQLSFAVITPAVICGAYAERMKFSSMLLFSVAWLFVVYVPMAHMVWGKGGLLNWAFSDTCRIPVFDFAGGTVVETLSGVSGLVCALMLGHRRRYLQEPMPPHNLALAFTGAALLWIGWFGFNAGSALSAGGLAMLAAVNTQLSAAAATIAWPLCEWLLRGKPTVLGAISGAVAGLVAITPACGFVTPGAALAIGAIGGLLAFAAVTWLKMKLRYDDTLDVFGVHGVAGIWGTIAIGLFLTPDVNAAIQGANPALYATLASGTSSQLLNQVYGVLIACVLAAGGTAVILTVIKYTIGLRVTPEQEIEGLDLSQHGEEAYNDRD